MESYFIPAEFTRTEIEIDKSRFISSIKRAQTVEEARAFIQEIRNEFKDASHNVPAFRIGFGKQETLHCSDDGEPSGTAGRPALSVLKGSQFGDTVVVVTRYFGGKKLGKGGLVRAYQDAVKEVLQTVPKAKIVQVHVFQTIVQYPEYESVKRILEENSAVIANESFTEKVTLDVQVISEEYEKLQEILVERTSGRVSIDLMETFKDQLIPVI